MADGRWAPYRVVLASRLRSQAQYRISFGLDLLNSVAYGVVEFVEVYLVLHTVRLLGGLDWQASLLVFALARTGFAIADLVVGHIDGIPAYVRTGTLDTLMLRPLPVLAQLVVGDVHLRRLGRLAIYLTVLAVALPRAPIDWTPARAALVPATLLGGGLIFSALFVIAGAAQFHLVDGGEFANAFTYGGGYASSYPTSVLPAPARAFFTAVVPAAFVGYLPTLALLGLDGPPGLPRRLGWFTPLVGLVSWLVALGLWRRGIRHYQGGGG